MRPYSVWFKIFKLSDDILDTHKKYLKKRKEVYRFRLANQFIEKINLLEKVGVLENHDYTNEINDCREEIQRLYEAGCAEKLPIIKTRPSLDDNLFDDEEDEDITTIITSSWTDKIKEFFRRYFGLF
ncbi:MAG: hypothetical protein JW791_02150 [Nanoarchaeota archaeon]|nr:hypothetical protein [Nanoarchaeota archaeon]